jgi:hypothetical protein
MGLWGKSLAFGGLAFIFLKDSEAERLLLFSKGLLGAPYVDWRSSVEPCGRVPQRALGEPSGQTFGTAIAGSTDGDCVYFTLVLEEQRG